MVAFNLPVMRAPRVAPSFGMSRETCVSISSRSSPFAVSSSAEAPLNVKTPRFWESYPSKPVLIFLNNSLTQRKPFHRQRRCSLADSAL